MSDQKKSVPTPAPKPAAPQAETVGQESIEDMVKSIKQEQAQKKGEDAVKKSMGKMGFSRGGSTSAASKRADGIAQRGKTRGRVY